MRIAYPAIYFAATVAASLLAQSAMAQGNSHCTVIGGAMITNFNAIIVKGVAPATALTLGTVTGGLKGAVSAQVLQAPASLPGNFLVQHHIVTAEGDTINFDEVNVYAAPVTATVLGLVVQPLRITGGTGKFAGATGTLTGFGALQLDPAVDPPGMTVFRYTGQVCFR